MPKRRVRTASSRDTATSTIGIAANSAIELPRSLARRRPARKREPEQVKARILKAATAAFCRLGFTGARMRSIADDAGITIQLLTHHARSKENLWRMVVEHLRGEYERIRAQSPELAPGASASDRLRSLIADSVRFTAALPEVHRLVTLEAAHLTPRLLYLIETFSRKPFDDFCALIKQAQKEGTLRPVNPARLRFAIVAMAAVPFSVAAEYEHLTGKNPFSVSEIERTIELIENLVFH